MTDLLLDTVCMVSAAIVLWLLFGPRGEKKW
jgi:hypothetical protein